MNSVKAGSKENNEHLSLLFKLMEKFLHVPCERSVHMGGKDQDPIHLALIRIGGRSDFS